MISIEAVQSETVSDRRRAHRTDVRYLRFYSPVPGNILNVSEEGMCLETVVELRHGVEYQFRIRHGSMLFDVRASVQWCRSQSTLASSAGTTLQMFRSGLSFREPIPTETLEFLTSQATTD